MQPLLADVVFENSADGGRTDIGTIQRRGQICHHMRTFDGPEPKGWGVLELAAGDRSRAIAGVFQLSNPQQSEYLLRLRGLDVGKRYRMTGTTLARCASGMALRS